LSKETETSSAEEQLVRDTLNGDGKKSKRELPFMGGFFTFIEPYMPKKPFLVYLA